MSTATPYGYALRVDGHLDHHWRFRRQESVGRWLTAVPHSLEDHRAMFEEPDVSLPPSSSNGTVR